MDNGKTYGSALAELDDYLGALQKTAAERSGQDKKASETSEDPTSHPVEGKDDQLEPAPEGAHASELESNITSDVGPQNINDAAPAADTEPKPVAMTTAATTGKDPSNETGGVKFDKDDPGTSHPATTGGEKGASYREHVKLACEKFGAEKVVTEIGNSLMADIAVCKGETPPTDLEKAAGAGAAAADTVVNAQVEAQLPRLVQHTIKLAEAGAGNLFQYYVNYAAEKRANGEENPEEAISGEGVAGEAGEEGALPAEDLAQLAGVAGMPEGGDMPPEAAMGPEAGGLPPEAAMGPEAGGLPPEAAALGGEMGGVPGEPGEDEIVEALSEALADAGVTPEELAAAISAQQGGGEAPIEQKMAAVNVANRAVTEVNRYRNLKAAGRITHEKKAGIQLVWSVRQMVKDVMGK